MKLPILVVTPYPPLGQLYGNKYSALASYAKNTIDGVIKISNKLKFEVLADIIDGKVPVSYSENGVLVKRQWKRNSLKSLVNLFLNCAHSKSKVILWQFEWGMFGSSKIQLPLVALGWLLLRFLFNKKLIIISHGVLIDASKIAQQIGLNKSRYKIKLISLALLAIYSCMVWASNKVVVLEEVLRKRLLFIPGAEGKVVVIPHGVPVRLDRVASSSKTRDNKNFTILCFGFISWYKGTDWIVDTYSKLVKKGKLKNTKLVVAGGGSNVHKNEPLYRKYLNKVIAVSKNCKQIVRTGHVPNKNIAKYFINADIVVLPYRAFLSSSGPQSFALTYKKPIIYSSILKDYTLSSDFKQSQVEVGLTMHDVMFDMSEESFHDLIEKMRSDRKTINKMEKFSDSLYKKRNWDSVGHYYLDMINKL